MSEVIKVPQTGKQLDADLKEIVRILDVAPDHEGEVLYIRHGRIALEDGDNLFNIVQLQGGT